ncbi:hypothetical protein ACLK1T_26830 [Escherichia coli]
MQELENKEGGTVAARWGWWLKLKPRHFPSLRISRGDFPCLWDPAANWLVEESQELALKDDSPLPGSHHFPYRSVFIRHQKVLSV